ncbi:MAG: helix-turn-helix domain-containing protein [Oscillospiraceae bacterium]|nr:helix-turn-helix domain-containing protein [Oscillospiraceae bacterium]
MIFEEKTSLSDENRGTTGKKLRKIRVRKKLQAQELAKQCNTTKTAISNYEMEIRQISNDKIKAFAAALGVSVHALYDYHLRDELDMLFSLFEMEEYGAVVPFSDNENGNTGVLTHHPILKAAIQEWTDFNMQYQNGEISDDDYQNWKDSFPSGSENLPSQSNSSSADEGDTTSHPDSKTDGLRRKNLLLFQSLESRFLSITHAQEVSLEMQERICSYVNCSIEFLNDRSCVKYTPNGPHLSDVSDDGNVLFDILDIMDKHTDTESYRTIQIQLSRIVLYHLAQKGFLTKVLRAKELPQQKTDYLFEGVKPRFNTYAFGYFYSELAVIRKLTGLSYQEMFMGSGKEQH